MPKLKPETLTPTPEEDAAATAAAKTMSSREIAELTGSTHDNVLKTIRRIIAEGVVFKTTPIETPYIHPQNGQTYSEFWLNFRDTMLVISGYSATVRAKIIELHGEGGLLSFEDTLNNEQNKALSDSLKLRKSRQQAGPSPNMCSPANKASATASSSSPSSARNSPPALLNATRSHVLKLRKSKFSEIAELTGTQHAHVMRDIRTMLAELHGEEGIPSFGDTHAKEWITIRLSRDVVETFRASGDGWQTRVDCALKEWLKTRTLG